MSNQKPKIRVQIPLNFYTIYIGFFGFGALLGTAFGVLFGGYYSTKLLSKGVDINALTSGIGSMLGAAITVAGVVLLDRRKERALARNNAVLVGSWSLFLLNDLSSVSIRYYAHYGSKEELPTRARGFLELEQVVIGYATEARNLAKAHSVNINALAVSTSVELERSLHSLSNSLNISAKRMNEAYAKEGEPDLPQLHARVASRLENVFELCRKLCQACGEYADVKSKTKWNRIGEDK